MVFHSLKSHLGFSNPYDLSLLVYNFVLTGTDVQTDLRRSLQPPFSG